MSITSKQVTGAWGEQQAIHFLEKNSYHILAQNFRTRQGEIDIIAWHEKPHFGNTLVFIEVKTRKNDDGSAERAVSKTKMKSIFFAARAFCVQKKINIENTPIQFEQISVYRSEEGNVNIKQYIIPVE